MPLASPHHRHQSSLEGIIDFSADPLAVNLRAPAKRRFYLILERLEKAGFEQHDVKRTGSQYNRPQLIRLTYEYARSEESQDSFLRAFFEFIALPLDEVDDADILCSQDLEVKLFPAVFDFADYLIDNFFLPLKASSKQTPQPSPAYHSAVEKVQGLQFAGTPARVAALRGSCLIRDRHRCVISRRFDYNTASERMKASGNDARDDDGSLLGAEDNVQFDALEVAHIIPHSLSKTAPNQESERSRQTSLAILNMFDSGVVHLIEGAEIDRPRNAVTLTLALHRLFGNFDVFFTPMPDQPHTYRIEGLVPPALLRGYGIPVVRTLYLTQNRTIDPPSPRLLAIHRAIAHILHLSGAGYFIDTLLRDMEETGIMEDGSTDLGRFVSLGLSRWWNSGVAV